MSDILIFSSLFAYFSVFLILLRIRSIKLSKSWFVPFFAIYFGLCFATLLALFCNGTESSFSKNDSFFSVLVDVLNPLNSRGKVLYGGYFGAMIGILLANIVSRQKSLPDLLDISAISISLLFAVWRIGCFCGGCCYGRPSSMGVSFGMDTAAFADLVNTSLVSGDHTVPLLPTQLISCAGDFAIFIFLFVLFCRNKIRYPYFYFFAHALLYGLGRFTIEFLRIDPREFWGPLSMSQWLSLVLIAVSLVFFIKNRKEIRQ